MHLIKDENGNIIHHGHEHTHEHMHADGVVHGHSHSHEDGESHEHVHPDEINEKNKLLTLLKYMFEHNEHHAEELEKMAGKMEENTSASAIAAVREAVAEFRKGNEKLGHALELMEAELKQ